MQGKKLTTKEYKSPFSTWDEVASVRTKPSRTYSQTQQEKSQFFFSPELVPITQHPLVQERGEKIQKIITVYQLYAHLDFTENLEHEAVNYVSFKLGRNTLGLDMPYEMIEDAWKLYVDEAYHFKFSAQLINQVELATGIERPLMEKPRFLRLLHQLASDVPPEKKDLVYLFFSIVSETLITGTLNVVPRDERIVPTVREVIGDHAEDEARHHVYFAKVLHQAWIQLSEADQRLIGTMLPKFIYGFLEHDLTLVRCWLKLLDFPKKLIERIIEESYPRDQIILDVRSGSKMTLKHFKRNGLFDEPYTREAFQKHHLIH
ncbi:diiron oxygenase [Chengkuizengella sediminis]|uniref:diiron oxygenase n=1 Tax=Chengkuizengella sediminis TaxID=1885917 RepID=UPI00138954DB|nr:diiron oxygenase [Chengkuizengella sediminis]NDI33445.1 diiron oxygenase [Chengkuizengella sediminis]